MSLNEISYCRIDIDCKQQQKEVIKFLEVFLWSHPYLYCCKSLLWVNISDYPASKGTAKGSAAGCIQCSPTFKQNFRIVRDIYSFTLYGRIN